MEFEWDADKAASNLQRHGVSFAGSSMPVRQLLRNENSMKPQTHRGNNDDIRPEYDFSHGVRGKHYEAYRAGTNVVFLEPDVAKVFTDSASVNQVLRLLLQLAEKTVPAKSRLNKALQPTSRRRRKGKKSATAKAARG